jgi:hypothetical protein
MSWTKEADWLPVSNALAQVVFWKKDLKQALNFLAMLETMKVSKDNVMWSLGYEDVEESTDGLKKAKSKLKETLKRVNG